MEKISLKMGVMWWWEQACEKHGTLVSPELRKAVQHILLAMPFMQVDPTMRRLCVSAFCDFFDYDLRHVCILFYLLGKYGLRIEMSNDELEEYQRAYEHEQKETQIPKLVTSGYITCEMIDWEQRRWQLATSFASHRTRHISFNGHPIRVALTAKQAIEEADEFIEEYKKSLNTEE